MQPSDKELLASHVQNLNARVVTLETMLWECLKTEMLPSNLSKKILTFLSPTSFSERNAAIYKAHMEGQTFKQIAEAHNISLSRAMNIFNKYDKHLQIKSKIEA